MMRALTLTLVWASALAQLTLTLDPAAPALFTTRASYLSINLDSGSLYNAFDFTNAPFTALVRNLARAAPTQFRIGGGAADGVLFTGAGGASGRCATPGIPGITTCVSEASFDAMLAFSAAAGVGLVWDLNAALRADARSPWNASNAAALLAHAAGAPSRGLPVPAAWQLGNEIEDFYKLDPPLNISGAQLAADYHTLRALLLSHDSLRNTSILGPSACCEDRRPILPDFVGPVVGALDALDVHAYPIPRLPNNTCVPAGYTSKAAMQGIITAIQGWKALGASLLARGLPLILGETATSAHGGCDGLSNVFVSGFTFMLELGTLGELGVAQVNRQDVAGWSSNSGPSSYALLGPPGWSGGATFPRPHPDYWVALLWKQLVGRRVLNSTLASASATPAAAAAAGALLDQVDAHVWCNSASSSMVITYFAMDVGAGGVALALPPALAPLPRTEYILTAAPPAGLYADGVALNGVALEALESGELAAWPLPGVQGQGQAVTLRPWSYGFIVLDAAHAAACA